MSKAKKVKKKTKRWKLFDGVGFQPDVDTDYSEYSPACHHVVLIQSLHHGTDVHGPFLTRDAAHKWIREGADGELWERFDTSNVPGVSCIVIRLDVPTAIGGCE